MNIGSVGIAPEEASAQQWGHAKIRAAEYTYTHIFACDILVQKRSYQFNPFAASLKLRSKKTGPLLALQSGPETVIPNSWASLFPDQIRSQKRTSF